MPLNLALWWLGHDLKLPFCWVHWVDKPRCPIYFFLGQIVCPYCVVKLGLGANNLLLQKVNREPLKVADTWVYLPTKQMQFLIPLFRGFNQSRSQYFWNLKFNALPGLVHLDTFPPWTNLQMLQCVIRKYVAMGVEAHWWQVMTRLVQIRQQNHFLKFYVVEFHLGGALLVLTATYK